MITKEQAIELAIEFNKTHTTKLKYIVQAPNGTWEGWVNKPEAQPGYWGGKLDHPVILLKPEIFIESWRESLVALDDEYTLKAIYGHEIDPNKIKPQETT